MGLLIFFLGEFAIDKVKDCVRQKADEANTTAIRRVGVKLTLFVLGFLLIIFSSGAVWAVWTAAILFNIVFFWTAINVVKVVKAAWGVLGYIFCASSVSEGILDYVCDTNPTAGLGVSIYSGARKVGQISSFGMITLPKPVEIVKEIVCFLAKKFIFFWLFIQSMAYFMRNGICSHILEVYTGKTFFQICCMPLEPIINLIPFI